MKAVIMAGGEGTRLRPQTSNLPKPMVPLVGRPMMEHIVRLLRRHGARFASFSVIGGGIFIAGLLIQAVLTSGLHVPSFISYIFQAVVSVEAKRTGAGVDDKAIRSMDTVAAALDAAHHVGLV